MAYYPVFLNVRGKPCLVVGGGEVAFQKARGLEKAGARVTAVAPRFVPRFSRLKTALRRRRFKASDITDRPPFLAIAATDDAELNQRISSLCRRARVWANVADVTSLCDFIMPAVVRSGGVTVAVSTGGASPALAKFLKKEIGKTLGPRVSELRRFLAKSRPRLLTIPMDERRKMMETLLTSQALKNPSRLMAHFQKRLPRPS